ncbi:hypothetical protein Hamer_G004673 [Homarus americanus]|uniref:Uncharacterized protein n=1 Tax=Homarus americanus TaxID=6706 RepID=A0A8J5K4U3_HOMAM|nr:hypothetical protein Hamer_G004673 [Homarus americanus]
MIISSYVWDLLRSPRYYGSNVSSSTSHVSSISSSDPSISTTFRGGENSFWCLSSRSPSLPLSPVHGDKESKNLPSGYSTKTEFLDHKQALTSASLRLQPLGLSTLGPHHTHTPQQYSLVRMTTTCHPSLTCTDDHHLPSIPHVYG